MNIYKERYHQLLKDILELSNCWKETEKLTGDEAWGECATSIDEVVENHAEQM